VVFWSIFLGKDSYFSKPSITFTGNLKEVENE